MTGHGGVFELGHLVRWKGALLEDRRVEAASLVGLPKED